MKKDTFETKILELAETAYKNKVIAEKNDIETKLLQDKEIISEILKIVKKRLVFKIDYSNRVNPKYILVTEEILLADYITPADIYFKRTEICADGKEPQIILNGHNYYHLGGLIKKYKHDINKALEYNQWENDRLREKKTLIENLEKTETNIKKMLIDYEGFTNK